MDSIVIECLNARLKGILTQHSESYDSNTEYIYKTLKIKKLNSVAESKERTQFKKGTKHSVAEGDSRCCGRIWGGKHTVKKTENGWVYGIQCSRKKHSCERYCLIHLRSLTHGDFFQDPPHNHYEKYKQA